MTNFAAVKSGTPIRQSPTNSAAWINAVSMAAENYQYRTAGGRAGHRAPLPPANFAIVRVQNKTGSDLVRGEVVQLGDYRLDTINPRALWFEADKPADPLDLRIAVMRQAVPNDKQGDAQLIGVTTAIVNVTSTDHRFAAVVDGSVKMESGTSGLLQIISPLTETGEQEVAGLIGAASSAALSVSSAMITAEVPAFTEIDGNDKTCTPGRLNNGCTLLDWKKDQNGEYIMPLADRVPKQEPDPDSLLEPPPEIDAVRDVINETGTRIRGSVDEPVIIKGRIEKITSDNGSDEVFIAESFEGRTLPGYARTGDEANAKSVFHDSVGREFTLGRDEC